MGRVKDAMFATVAVTLATGCTDTAPVTGPFEQSGELIALSGGDAGAANACIACHGLDGEGDGKLVPRLAGLDPGYFVRQLELYDVGQRRHAAMEAIAARLSWDNRLAVANHYADMAAPGAPGTHAADCTPHARQLVFSGDASRNLPACTTCHGGDLAGAGSGGPPLAWQTAAYNESQLRAWRSGRRYGDPQGAMGEVSRLLHERELRAVAACVSALPDAPGRREPRAASLRERRPDPRSGA
ncbi:c-type cytochrome [Pelagerythrobacter rhizovicinus]|uniref:C-type cytochrome n=1 Tax=Pelagerythrobacter rhizovicinus TaxID=2268576 RepID=A0A4Q2KJK3_9SPHN|nr:c-type cytochrome [Pelagerythrobacter rhizovicinus]